MVKSEHVEAVLVYLSFMLIKNVFGRKSNVAKDTTNGIAQKYEKVADKYISNIVFWILTIPIDRQRDIMKVVAATKDAQQVRVTITGQNDGIVLLQIDVGGDLRLQIYRL